MPNAYVNIPSGSSMKAVYFNMPSNWINPVAKENLQYIQQFTTHDKNVLPPETTVTNSGLIESPWQRENNKLTYYNNGGFSSVFSFSMHLENASPSLQKIPIIEVESLRENGVSGTLIVYDDVNQAEIDRLNISVSGFNKITYSYGRDLINMAQRIRFDVNCISSISKFYITMSQYSLMGYLNN